MRDDEYPGYTDSGLKRMREEISTKAKECNIEVRLIGGLLKFTPVSLYTKVLLELEQSSFRIRISKHRNSRLTYRHKGRAVSKKWVIGFLERNASEAKRIMEERLDEQKKTIEQENATPAPKSNGPSTAPKKETSYGYEFGKSVCPICGGDGGAAGQCYKCGGSGWA